MHPDGVEQMVQRTANDVFVGLPGEVPADSRADQEQPPAIRQRAEVRELEGYVPDELSEDTG